MGDDSGEDDNTEQGGYAEEDGVVIGLMRFLLQTCLSRLGPRAESDGESGRSYQIELAPIFRSSYCSPAAVCMY